MDPRRCCGVEFGEHVLDHQQRRHLHADVTRVGIGVRSPTIGEVVAAHALADGLDYATSVPINVSGMRRDGACCHADLLPGVRERRPADLGGLYVADVLCDLVCVLRGEAVELAVEHLAEVLAGAVVERAARELRVRKELCEDLRPA